jgi:hypothetical protein
MDNFLEFLVVFDQLLENDHALFDHQVVGSFWVAICAPDDTSELIPQKFEVLGLHPEKVIENSTIVYWVECAPVFLCLYPDLKMCKHFP